MSDQDLVTDRKWLLEQRELVPPDALKAFKGVVGENVVLWKKKM
jgi:hypothetical protein